MKRAYLTKEHPPGWAEVTNIDYKTGKVVVMQGVYGLTSHKLEDVVLEEDVE